MGRLVWTGVFCCIGALSLNLFPAAVYALGIDRSAAWPFFGFGLFLILVSLFVGGRRSPKRDRYEA
ncbi:MAG: hypothetical protein AB7P23_01885 [Amphiplicatus sp.]